MSRLAVVPQHDVDPDPRLLERVEALATRIAREDPKLRDAGPFADQIPEQLEDAPTAHLDDLGEIPQLERFHSSVFLEDRARLRAADGDFVVSCAAPNPAFEWYTWRKLRLGKVSWLHPEPHAGPLCVATASFMDRRVRKALVHAIRTGGLRYVHPNMGTSAAWTLAKLLADSSRHRVQVIAPPPPLTQRVNDKLWFARVVEELFGAGLVPRTLEAYNYTTLAAAVMHLLQNGSRSIVVKLPDSAGGSGNQVLDARPFRGASASVIRRRLRRQLASLPWRPGAKLLVGTWQDDVLAAPSAQLWIPPEAEAPPTVEGIYEQAITGPTGEFRGSRPAQLPAGVTEEFAHRAWMLGRLFQRLRYVGRCSFDAILIGTDVASCRLELIECNGRWGGTSTPMTLMNRLFGNWRNQPHAARKCVVEGLSSRSFRDVLDAFGSDVFDASTGQGSFVFYSPGRMDAHSGIDVIAFADDWEEAEHIAETDAPERLHAMATGQISNSHTGG